PRELWSRLDHLFQDAALAEGYALHDATFAKKNCLWSGYCDGINLCKYDARQGSFMAYLPLARERGVRMMPDCYVERVIIEKTGEGGRVKGVEYTQDGVRHTLEVPRVIVSSGMYGNPPLLYRSGYGPRELTDNLVVENPNVGRHTDNRPQVRGPIGIFDEPITDGGFQHGGAFYVYHDLTSNGHYDRLQLVVSPSEVGRPDQVAIGADAPQFGRAHKDYMRDLGVAARMTDARREISRRAVTTLRVVRPRNIHGWINEWGEQIYAGNDPSIIKPLEQGRELVYELLKKMGAREVVGMDLPLRVGILNTFVGSCIVGVDPRTSVVNPSFESHDVEGLFVCDASVVPRAATQGYAGTVATVAVFAASRIVERHFSRG
ncbi:MAG: GMC family oxidoreductase N-terminal domain-containing protein, partial [Acidobacteriota bacterium]